MISISRRAATLLALLFGFALLAAACGSEDTTSDAATDDGATEDSAMDDEAMDDMDDGSMEDMAMDGEHDHGVLEVPEGMAVPTIAVSTTEDSSSGVNLFVELGNFTIAPESASTDPVDGEGHLHLYVDGERVMRFYNTALHLGDLEPGEREITVEVSANNHSAYAVDGEAIRATTTVTVPESDGGHAHGDEAALLEAANPVPTVALSVTEDPKSGWNVAVELTDFEITPEAEGTDPVDGQGHLHLYVDGEKITRLYGTHWHVSSLTEGSHEIMVELSANNHLAYADLDGNPIMAMATVEVSAEQAMADDGHDHGEHGDEHSEHSDDEGHGDEHSHDHGEAQTDEEQAALGDPDQMIEVAVADGEVTIESERVDVALGSTVMIIVSADITEEIHLHSYDVLADVTPDEPGQIVFVADVPGVFEIEFEQSGMFLFEVAVS